jgi:hypothetical protein
MSVHDCMTLLTNGHIHTFKEKNLAWFRTLTCISNFMYYMIKSSARSRSELVSYMVDIKLEIS